MEMIKEFWTTILTAATLGLGWFMRTLWEKQEKTSEALADLKVHIAKEYVTNDRAEAIASHIDKRFDRFEEKLNQLFTPTDRRQGDHR